MVLYELKKRNPTLSVEYFTAQAPALKAFNTEVKALKAIPESGAYNVSATVCRVALKTDLVAADWVELLQSDGPGLYCEKTPRDFITERQEVRQFTREIRGRT